MNNKCKRCGSYKPLIGSYCSECLSLNAYDNYKVSEEILGDIEDDEVDKDFNFSSFYNGYCNSLVKEYEEKHKGETEQEPTLQEAYEVVFNEIMQANGIRQEDVIRYKPQLNSVVKAHIYQLRTGFYRLATKEDFERTHLGVVRDVKGRWVVYSIESPESRAGVLINLTAEQEEYVSTANSLIQKYLKDKETTE